MRALFSLVALFLTTSSLTLSGCMTPRTMAAPQYDVSVHGREIKELEDGRFLLFQYAEKDVSISAVESQWRQFASALCGSKQARVENVRRGPMVRVVEEQRAALLDKDMAMEVCWQGGAVGCAVMSILSDPTAVETVHEHIGVAGVVECV